MDRMTVVTKKMKETVVSSVERILALTEVAGFNKELK